MSSQPKTFFTPEEYLEIERKAEYKSEFFQGEIFAMAGATRRHGRIVLNVGGELRQRLRNSPCEIYVSDMRLSVSPNGLYTYPDVVVACDNPKFIDEHLDTLLNPQIIVEVLSKSTSDYDRGGKFVQYRGLPSLQEYLTVEQDKPYVECWSRQPNRWVLTEFHDLNQTIRLASIDCELPMAEIYHKVDFSA